MQCSSTIVILLVILLFPDSTIKQAAMSADHTQFIPFIGGQPRKHSITSPYKPLSEQINAGIMNLFVPEGAKQKKRKSKAKKTALNVGRGAYCASQMKFNFPTPDT